jgi:hypothetical protein
VWYKGGESVVMNSGGDGTVSVVIYSGVMERAFVLIVERCECGNIQWGDGTCVCAIVERYECGNIQWG